MKRDEAKEGDIGCFYADKSFLKVKQAFGIDKICFSFVKKGTNGDGIDIYLPIDEFDLLCDKILNNTLHKKILEEKQKNVEYPGAYTCPVGKDGSKKICIGAGKASAVCIQGSVKTDNGKNNNIFIGTTYKDLVIMAKWWQRCSIPYYSSMVEDIYKASMRRPSADELDDDVSSETKPKNNTPAATTSKENKNSSDRKSGTVNQPTNKEQAKDTNVSKENTSEAKEEVTLLSVVNSTPLEELKSKNGYACQIEKAGNKLPPIVFYNSVCEKIPNFESFRMRLSESNIPFSVVCTPITMGKNNKPAYRFERFAK